MGLDLDTKGIDLSISKGFTMLTPYAGVGKVWIESDPSGFMALKKESIKESKLFGGLQISLSLLKVTVEAEYAEVPSYTLKLSAGL